MKKSNIFIALSLVFLSFMVIFYGYRFFYYYNKSKEAKESVGNEVLLDIVKKKQSPLIKKVDNNLYYTGNSLNNYVYYSNRFFRILGIENDSILLVDDVATILPFDKIESYFLYYTSSLHDYDSITSNCLDNCINYPTLLTREQVELVNNDGSYLFNDDFYWLSDGSYVARNEIKEQDNGIYGVKPVIRLRSDALYYGGTGTYFDPYFIDEEDANNFLQKQGVHVGDYITYSNMVWKVISVEDNIKLVATESIGKHKFDSFDLEDETSLGYYLNNTFEIDKTSLKEGKFYITDVNDTERVEINAYVGLLTMGDLFVNECNDGLILTTNNKNKSIYKITDGKAFEDSYNNYNEIYPVIYLDKNVKISGNGTIESPFVVGEL